MTEPSQPDTDSSTGTMILGVQCACRVIQWKDGDHSIEPCQLHAHADDLLKALERAHGNASFGVDCADKRDFMRALGALRTIVAETAAVIEKARS